MTPETAYLIGQLEPVLRQMGEYRAAEALVLEAINILRTAEPNSRENVLRAFASLESDKPRKSWLVASDHAERVVVGTLLFRPEALAVVLPILQPFHFADAKARAIYSAALANAFEVEAGVPLDVLMAAGVEQADCPALHNFLVDYCTTPQRIKGFAQKVRADYERRQVEAKVLALTSRYHATEDTLERTIIEDELRLLPKPTAADDDRPVEALANAIIARMGQPGARARRVRFGLRDLDRELHGGLNAEFVIIAARPSVGKSSLLRWLAVNVAAREDRPYVIYFTLEDSREVVLEREIAGRAGLSVSDLQGDAEPDDVVRAQRAAGELCDLDIEIIHRPRMTVEAITAEAKRLHSLKPSVAVLVDYLQIVSWSDKKAREYDALNHITNELAELRKELGIPVVVAAQLNRTADDKLRPTYSDIKGTGNVEQQADVILLLHQSAPDRTEVICGKRKNGRKNWTVNLGWVPERTSYYDVDDAPARPEPPPLPSLARHQEKPKTGKGRKRGPGDEHE